MRSVNKNKEQKKKENEWTFSKHQDHALIRIMIGNIKQVFTRIA